MVNILFSANKFWETLDTGEKKRIEALARKQSVRRRQVLFSPGDQSDSCYIVREGLLRMVRAMQRGRELTVCMLESGDMFGESAVIEPGNHTHYAEALSDSEVIVIPADHLRTTLKSDHDLLSKFTKEQWRRRRETELRLEDLVFRDVPARLARTLIWLSERFGEAVRGKGLGITLKLTHQELGSLVGTTRETTTLVLNRFRRQGLIAIDGRRLFLLQLEALQGVASTMQRK